MIQFIRSALLNVRQLVTAVSFYRLEGADLRLFQYVYPTIIAALVLIGYRTVVGSVFKIDLSLIVGSASTLMGVLIGFYIAALAAVTSFPNESLNSLMAGKAPPKIRERPSGNKETVTRRRFLAILLGYCAFLSILIYAVGAAYSAFSFAPNLGADFVAFLVGIWWIFYTWLASSLMVVTMLCLHYLIDRMHRS